MDWVDKQVLVTGAGGFIGSHLCERLLELGARVTALVRYNSKGSYGSLEDAAGLDDDRLTIVLGDIQDENVFRTHLPDKDLVYHLAALPGIPYSFVYPRDVFSVNAGGSLNLMIAARELGVGTLADFLCRDLRHCPVFTHGRGSPPVPAVPLRCEQGGDGETRLELLLRRRPARQRRPSLQQLRSPSVDPGGDPHGHHAVAGGR